MRRRLHVLSGTLVLAISLGVPPAGSWTTTELGPGVTSTRIKIGYHAPFTGPAPLPSSSLDRADDLYWEWRERRDRPINGRFVDTVIKNDNYNPSQAVAVCKEMVERDKVFMLAGVLQATGPDLIQACARYAASVNVPYVSLGSTAIGIARLPRYFSMSATWPRQSRMLAGHLVSNLGAGEEKNGMLRFGTPNFEDSHDTFARAMRERNAPLDYDRSIPKTSGAEEARVVVQEMKAAAIDNVFVLTSPRFFLQLVRHAGDANYDPLWTGIGITMTATDSVATIACRNGVRHARFFSPVPAYEDRDDFDKAHDRAMQVIHDDEGDSITWLGWATAKATGKMLDRGGRELTRRRFENRVERSRRFRTGVLPRFRFTPRDHLGGNAIHVLRARCSDEKWHTIRRFVSSF